MKKCSYILILLILLFPIVADALVTDQTNVGIYNTRLECDEKLALNDATLNSNATNGFYLTCLKITCLNNSAEHENLAPILSNITCANGNTNPFISVRQSAITDQAGLEQGATCSSDDQEEGYLAETYATVRYQFNCLQNDLGGTYTTTTTTQPITQPNDNPGVESPPTGINTYYIALTSIVVILSVGLYIVNKKNLFKKI